MSETAHTSQTPRSDTPALGRQHRRTAVLWLVALLVIAGLEVGVFNLAHWRTTHVPAVTMGSPVFGGGITIPSPGDADDSSGTGTTSDTAVFTTFTITNPDTATIDIPVRDAATGGAAEIQSIRLSPAASIPVSQATAHANGTASRTSATASFYTADTDTALDSEAQADAEEEADATRNTGDLAWRSLGDGVWSDPDNTLTYTSIPETQYTLAGQKSDENRYSTWLRISFENEYAGSTVSLASYEVNPTIPFSISLARIAVMLVIAAFVICFRPGSVLWRRRLDITTRGHKAATGAAIAVTAVVMLLVTQATGGMSKVQGVSYGWDFNHWFDPLQYQRLGEALLNGHLWLDLPVDNTLQSMSNPYSYAARHSLNEATGSVYFWDHAYFQGHYYSYFGVVPAVLLFAPFEALTGRWLPNWAASWVLGVVFAAFAIPLTMRFIQRFFPRASQALAWLCALTMLVANSAWYYLFTPSFYGIPVLASMAATAAALYLWLAARRNAATGAWAGCAPGFGGRNGGENGAASAASSGAASAPALDACTPGATRVSAWRVVLGCVLMALNFGCRPQFLVFTLFAFPIFWDEIRYSRQIFSRASWRLSCAIVLAFLAVIVPLLAYNAARFGSPLDVGSNYNLTAFDMTSQRPSRALLPIALLMQLLQPAAFGGSFPFIETVDNALPMPCEPSLGGFLALVPFALTALFFWMERRRLKERRVWALTAICVAGAAVVLLLDTMTAGVNNRYYGDFGMLLAFAAIAVACCLEESLRLPVAEGSIHDVPAAGGVKDATDDAAATATAADPRSLPAFRTGYAPARLAAFTAAAAVLFSLIMVFGGMFATGRYDALPSTNPFLFSYVKSWFLGLTM